MSILKPGDTPSLSSPLSKKTVGRPLPDYYETIPDISNLDALDLFDPMYVEDVEIENEDNLSLTIHRWVIIKLSFFSSYVSYTESFFNLNIMQV